MTPEFASTAHDALAKYRHDRANMAREAAERQREQREFEAGLERDRLEAVRRHDQEQAQMEKEAANRDKEREDKKKAFDEMLRNSLRVHSADRGNMADEAANRNRGRGEQVAEASAAKKRLAQEALDAEAARMARFRTIAGAAQTIAGGGSGGMVSGGIQLAGAGAFGARAAALAGGPVGVALAAAPLVLGALNNQADKATARMASFGQALAGEGKFSLTSNVKMATNALEQVPIVGQLAALKLKILTAGFVAAEQTIHAFIARGQELKGYSAPLSVASGQAEVRKIKSDIQEAQRVGPEIARLIEAQSEMDNMVRELLLPIKEAVAGVLADVFQEIKEIAKDVKPGAKAIAEVVGFGLKLGALLGTAPLRMLGRTIRLLHLFLDMAIGWMDRSDDKEKEAKNNDLLEQVFVAAKQPLPRVTVDDPAAHANEGRIALPRR